MITFIGIDPGATGAVALLSDRGLLCSRFDGDDPLEVLASIWPRQDEVVTAVEAVHAMPGQGVVSMFSFGRRYGQIEGWLKGSRIEFKGVSPRTWQTMLPWADGPKNAVKAFCDSQWGLNAFIYKGCRVPHQGSMDAACIALYVKRLVMGEIEPPAETKKRKQLRPLRLAH